MHRRMHAQLSRHMCAYVHVHVHVHVHVRPATNGMCEVGRPLNVCPVCRARPRAPGGRGARGVRENF